MKRTTTTFVFLVSAIFTASADVKLPVNCEAAQPKILSTSLIRKSDTERFLKSSDYGQSDTKKAYWIAYSDRDNNTTYTNPGGSAYGKLDFNEPVRIAKISGNYALVYSEPQKSVVYPKISAVAKTRGWVPLKNLLLWQSCPTNDQFIYNKALIVMNIDQHQTMSDGNKALCYHNPDTKDKGFRLRTTMEFYFVMKEVGNYSLLARQCKVDGTTDQVLYGWVNKAYYVPWDQRSCLEPNWNQEDAEYFRANGTTAKVYETTSLSKVRCNMPIGKTNTADPTGPLKYRLNPGAMRFPILDNKNDNSLYRCTAFAGSGEVSVPSGGYDGVDEIIDTKLQGKSRINIIVVIDGTKSMENFYKPMQDAIQQANTYFGTKNREVRVGVVIYRDYTDGQYLTEMLQMTSPNDPALAKFLKDGGKYGIKSSPADHTYAEALYKGLEVALDAGKMGYSAKNSNIMFVVGDCGNALQDKKCISQPAIVSKMVANNIQLAAFQVRNINEQSFLLFRKQMNDIVRDNMQSQYAKLSNNISSGFREIPNGYEFQAKLDKNFFMGSTHYASLGKEMPASGLYELVKSRYEQFGSIIDVWMKVINEADVTIGSDGGGGQMDMKFLETIFSADEIRRIKQNNSLMACSGYTPKQDVSGRDYWKPVIYISSDEFSNLREKLKPVADAARQGGTDRRPYVNAIKALIRAQVADLSESELNAMSVQDVMSVIGGLNLGIGATGGRTLLQIQDENIVKQPEFDALVQAFVKKYKKLEQIASQGYKFKVSRNNTTYYWLPAEDLP